jgi:hypothetical protein
MTDITPELARQLVGQLETQHRRYQELRQLTGAELAAVGSGELEELESLTGMGTTLMHEIGAMHADLASALATLAEADPDGRNATDARNWVVRCLDESRRASADLVRLMAAVEQRRDEAARGLADAGTGPALLLDIRG